jgi:WD40 repeat protein
MAMEGRPIPKRKIEDIPLWTSPSHLIRRITKQVMEYMEQDFGGEAIGLEDFVRLIFRRLQVPGHATFQTMVCLCTIFTDADDDGSHVLSYSELAGYMLNFEHRAERRRDICRYLVSSEFDQLTHARGSVDVVHIQARDELLVCEKGAKQLRFLKISNPMRTEVQKLDLDFSGLAHPPKRDEEEDWPPHPGDVVPLRVSWDPDENYACALTAKISARLIFWECGFTYKIKYRIACEEPQTGVWYSRLTKGWLSAATGGGNFVISCWDMKAEALAGKLTGHQGVVTDVLDIPTHNFIASASLDTVIMLWDAKTLMQVSKILDCAKGIRCLAYHPDFDYLFAAGFMTFASVYSPKMAGRKSSVGRLDAHIAPLVAVRTVGDKSPVVLTGDEMGYLRSWDVRKWECIQVFTPHQIPVEFTSFFVLERPGQAPRRPCLDRG